MVRTTTRQCIEQMLRFIESADYAGYDPYDAMNSPLVAAVAAKSKFVRMGATQVLRRSPVNLRPLLGVRKGHNPKGIGLFLWGYTKLYSVTREARYLERIEYLLNVLERLRSEGYSGNCWGYNFAWQSRTFYAPKKTPTIVNSAFIGLALLDCWRATGIGAALEMAIPIGQFLLNDLKRIGDDRSFCFSYTPLDDYPVHNANLLGAALLIGLCCATGDERLRDYALAALAYSMENQNDDGSWYYSEWEGYRWIDSFHTGFNLQAIRSILDAGLAQEHREAYEKGVDFYAKSFFLEDGTPKYYHDRIYPIDVHSPAQAIVFFSREGHQYRQLTDRVLRWMLEHLYSGKGFFYFRKGRFLTNRIPYMRWSQAWAFHGLTEYLVACEEGNQSCIATR